MGKLLELPPALGDLARDVAAAGGRLWVVGGAVRDGIRGVRPRDVDLEVHGLPAAALRPLLAARGRCVEVGRAFGVFKVDLPGGSFDVALPRPAGEGRRGGPVAEADPWAGLDAAARRRDLTMNAIAWDPLTGAIEDPLGGVGDLRAGLLRAADADTFLDDPLRAWRVARFAACFEMEIDPALEALCVAADVQGLPSERVLGELHRILGTARQPSRGLAPARRWGLLRALLPTVPLGAGAAMDRAVDRAALQGRALQDELRALALGWVALLGGASPEEAAGALEGLRVGKIGGFAVRRAVEGALRARDTLQVVQPAPVLLALADGIELDLSCRAAWCLGEGAAAEAAEANRLEAHRLGVAHAPTAPLLDARALGKGGVPPGPALGALLAQVRAAQHRGEVRTPEEALQMALGLWQATRDAPEDDR